MLFLLAPAVLGLTYFSLLIACSRVLSRPAAVLPPIAGGLLVAWEALLLNVLSALHLVVPWAVLTAHLLLISAVAVYDRTEHANRLLSHAKHRLARMRLGWMLVPLFAILFLCALWFPPSTPDSMGYHLARVAHWMQNRSVSYYPTPNDRQNVMGPGAEYLLLVLQVISRSDFWANCVQFAAYLIIVLSVPGLSRLAGVPARLCPWAAVLVAALPIALLEATTTQNDVVAGLIALALVGTSIRFLHRTPRWRPSDVVVLSLLVGSGYLTKPTALLASAPFLLGGGALMFTSGSVSRLLTHWRSIAAALAVLLALVGPDVSRKLAATGTILGARYEVYPLVGAWQERFLNATRAVCQNLPVPTTIRRLEDIAGAPHAPLYCDRAFEPNEDRAGNPLQLLVLLTSLLGGLAFWPRLGKRETLFAASVPLAWLTLHAFVRNQAFITRLQLPVLLMIPLTWGGFVAHRLPGSRLRVALLRFAGLASLCYGVIIACTNQFKPLSFHAMMTLDRTANYYLLNRGAFVNDNGTLAMLKQTGCSRLGLYIDGSSYDYPITWRATQAGVAVRHYMHQSRWPCLIFSDRGLPPAEPNQRWIGTAFAGVYLPGGSTP